MWKSGDVLLYSILLFVFTYGSLMSYKPRWLFDRDGSLREFGVGRKRKTVFPVWVVAILMAILCYVLASNYVRKN